MDQLKQPVFIVAGVPGSGKSWVCNQLKDEYHYIPHDGWNQRFVKKSDTYLENYAETLIEAAKSETKPILADCPFAERLLKEHLEKHGAKIVMIFLTVSPKDLINRYVDRNKPVPKGHFTRAVSVQDRAKEWGSFCGTSSQALTYLKEVRKLFNGKN